MSVVQQVEGLDPLTFPKTCEIRVARGSVGQHQFEWEWGTCSFEAAALGNPTLFVPEDLS
jgi:hypothetical protein